MNREAQIFKALADENRLRILSLLLEGELCVCEIMAALELPQSTVSRHLAYLRKSGLVIDRRQGTWMYYRLHQSERGLQHALLSLLEKHVANSPLHSQALERLHSFRKANAQAAC